MITRKDNSAINAPGDTKQLLRQEAFLLAMHQSSDEKRKLSQECVSLIAASRGYFDKILQEGHKAGTSKGQDVVNGLLKHVELQVGDTIAAIDDSLEMSLEDMALIENAIEGYFA
jgi:flagellar biosynthesis/type III secretory pathway protein FliH